MDEDNRSWENGIGAMAEHIFADGTGLPRPVFKRELQRDRGYEFVPAIGRIDVKGAATKPWFLPVEDHALQKHPGANYYALIWTPVDQSAGAIVGFATRAEMEASPHVPHIYDPEGRRTSVPDPIPGRWRPITQLYHADLLVNAVVRGLPARCWVCRGCASRRHDCVFAMTPPFCYRCRRRMVAADSAACLSAERSDCGDQSHQGQLCRPAQWRGDGAERVPRELAFDRERHRAGGR